MTYVPPAKTSTTATVLAATDTMVVTQGTVQKTIPLSTLKTFAVPASTGTTTTAGGTGGTTPPVESASGASITNATGTIYDASLNTFKLGTPPAPKTGLGVFRNGTYQDPTQNVVEGFYLNHYFWQKASDTYFYRWNGTSYDAGVATDPRSTGTGTTTPATTNASGTGGLYTYPAGTTGPFGGIGDTGSGAGPQAYLYGRSLGDLFGTYTYPNPGGLDVGYTLKQTQDKLFGVTGVRPKTMNAFNNSGYGDSTKIGDGTFPYGWHNDDQSISGPNGYMRPIIGCKIGFQDLGWGNPATYDAIAAGNYDSAYLADVNKWIEFGFKHLVFRYAYEMNGTFMPDYMGGNITDNQRHAAAHRHVILLVKNRCAQAGVQFEASFNPTYMNYTDTDIMNCYPGDDVIDIIDCDQYNPCYNRTLQNYSAAGAPLGTYAANQAAWIANANNRRKFWNYPGIKDDGDNHYSYGAWSALRTIAIAKAKGKAIAFSECGTGGVDTTSGNYNNYLNDDPEWVKWFWQICQSAISQGVPIAHINVWNIYADDGHWMYSAPDTYNPQPNVTLAYRKYFGDGSYSGGPTPSSGNGVIPSIGGSTSTTGGTGGTTTTSGGTGGTTTTSGGTGGTVTYNTLATVKVTGTNGTVKTLALNAQPPMNFYGSDTGLGCNINYFVGTDGNLILNSSADGVISACEVTRNGSTVTSLISNTTYVTGTSGGTTGTNAVAKVTDTGGHVANLTLTNPGTNDNRKQYYGSDTGLNANVQYFVGNDGNLYIDSSANGVISSVVVTRNGSAVTSLMPNSTYV